MAHGARQLPAAKVVTSGAAPASPDLMDTAEVEVVDQWKQNKRKNRGDKSTIVNIQPKSKEARSLVDRGLVNLVIGSKTTNVPSKANT